MAFQIARLQIRTRVVSAVVKRESFVVQFSQMTFLMASMSIRGLNKTRTWVS